jgi:hypothetical protein
MQEKVVNCAPRQKRAEVLLFVGEYDSAVIVIPQTVISCLTCS